MSFPSTLVRQECRTSGGPRHGRTSPRPDAGRHYWGEALDKFSARVRQIVSVGTVGGDLFAMYRIFALSTLSFVALAGEVNAVVRQRNKRRLQGCFVLRCTLYGRAVLLI